MSSADFARKLASARGHLANVRAHGNAEVNAVLVIENALNASEELAKALGLIAEERGHCVTCGELAGETNCTDCDCSYPCWEPMNAPAFAREALESVGPEEVVLSVDTPLPCPFCGCPLVGVSTPAVPRQRKSVKCPSCHSHGGYGNTDEEAIAAWNERVVPHSKELPCSTCGKHGCCDCVEEEKCAACQPLTEAEMVDQVADLTRQLDGMRRNRDNLRIYLLERTKERDEALSRATDAIQREGRARSLLASVVDARVEDTPEKSLDLVARAKIIEQGYRGGYEWYRNKWIGDQEEMIYDLVQGFVPRALVEEGLDLDALRTREVQRMGAAISKQSWHEMEASYNELRDKIDAELIRRSRATKD